MVSLVSWNLDLFESDLTTGMPSEVSTKWTTHTESPETTETTSTIGVSYNFRKSTLKFL